MLLSLNDVTAISCTFGRAGGISSCIAQNCATGYCVGANPPTCVCSRCNDGPSPIY